jgi:hypothetical protein
MLSCESTSIRYYAGCKGQAESLHGPTGIKRWIDMGRVRGVTGQPQVPNASFPADHVNSNVLQS